MTIRSPASREVLVAPNKTGTGILALHVQDLPFQMLGTSCSIMLEPTFATSRPPSAWPKEEPPSPPFCPSQTKTPPPKKNKPGGGDSCYPNKTPHSVYVLGTSPAFPKPGKSPNALSPCLTQTRARQPTGRRGSGSARTCLCSGQTTTLLQNSCSSSVGSDFTKYSFS